MNLLSQIIERLNQRIGAGNIFDQIYGLSELSADGNDKAWVHYIGNGQAVPVTNFDAHQATIFWAKRGKITVQKVDSIKLSGCKALYETKFTLSAYAVARKSHLPCDAADAQDWLASRVLRLVSGTDPLFKTSIGVVSYEVIPNGYANEVKSLTANYEFACVTIDVDVNVVSPSEDGCYDTCGSGDIPLPDLIPCTPCLTEVAVDGITIIGNGTESDPLIAIGGGGGGGILVALPFSTDHLTATGNPYTIGNVVWYLGNVYRCIANNDSILPTNTSYWVNLGAGFQAVERPSDWNATTGNNQILNKPTIPAAQVNSDWNASSGVAEILNKPTITPPQSLQEVTDVGNTTDNDIQFDAGVGILLDNTSRLREGTIDAGLGGSKGIAQICAVGYELKWEAGRLYVMDGNGNTIRWSLYNFNITPTVNDDVTKGYVIGSRWLLDDGSEYLCSDGTATAAVWTLQTVGGVTDVTATAPLSSSGGATPDISIQPANLFDDGYLTSADFTSFYNKFDVPTGTNADYLDGTGTPTPFPTIPTGTVTSVNSGINISVDNTNPAAPIINSLSDRYKTTSTTSNSVSNGSKNFTVDLNLSYIPLQEILVVHNPANHMHGEVTSYNAATGALVVDIKTHTGSGTYTAWTLNLDGTPVDALTGSGTANEIAYFTAARILASLPVATYPSLTELSYVKGVSSAIQTQINGKFNTPSGTTAQYVRGDGSLGSLPFELVVAASDETTALTTGTAKITFRMPRAITLTAVRASLTTAQASGNIFTVDINEAGTSILSTKLTIDNTEKTSTTAATPPVISDASLADDAEITIDIDQIGNGTATGLKVMLIGTYV